MDDDRKFLTLSDVAELLRCSSRQVYRIAALPGFPKAVVILGRTKRWVRSEVEAWLVAEAPRVA